MYLRIRFYNLHRLSMMDWKPKCILYWFWKIYQNLNTNIWFHSYADSILFFFPRMEIFCWLPIQDLIEHKLYFLFLICEPKMLGFIGVNPAMFGARLMPHSLSKYTVSNQREASRRAPGDSSRRPMLFSMVLYFWCYKF